MGKKSRKLQTRIELINYDKYRIRLPSLVCLQWWALVTTVTRRMQSWRHNIRSKQWSHSPRTKKTWYMEQMKHKKPQKTLEPKFFLPRTAYKLLEKLQFQCKITFLTLFCIFFLSLALTWPSPLDIPARVATLSIIRSNSFIYCYMQGIEGMCTAKYKSSTNIQIRIEDISMVEINFSRSLQFNCMLMQSRRNFVYAIRTITYM